MYVRRKFRRPNLASCLIWTLLVLQEKQKYEIMANTFKSLDDVINLFCELHDRYPGIIAIVDGVRSPVSSPQTTSVSSLERVRLLVSPFRGRNPW